jgi:protein-L-isoaspartate(D-aspartate) O-methyltransferase
VPAPLLPQLRVGGHLVVPVGVTLRSQELIRVTRRAADDYARESLGPVAFVPLIGQAGWPQSDPGGQGSKA